MERRNPPSREHDIPPEAVAIFRKMQACTDNCPECKRLDRELRRVLGLKPWEGPTLIGPDEKPVHPPRSAAYEWQPKGQALLKKLTELAKASALAEREPVDA